jgi:mycothiol synthase
VTSTRSTRLIRAPRERVYAALLDPAAWALRTVERVIPRAYLPVEPGRAPQGIRIEPPNDLAPVHVVLTEAFAEDWGYHPEPLERWAEEQTASPSHDPSLWLLACDGDEPVGALTANVWGDRGWVNEIGVRRSHRGHGIAAAMLRRSFATFADRGLRRVLLNVDSENPTGATALYERVGMRVVWRWDLWERAGSGA